MPTNMQTSSVASAAVSSSLAMELAAGLTDIPEILEKYDLSKSQLKRILQDGHFKQLFNEAKEVWNGMDNVRERIRAKSMHLVEDSILPLYSMIHNADVAPSARIDAFAKLMRIADMEPRKEAESTGEKFSITINVPGAEESLVIEADPTSYILEDE